MMEPENCKIFLIDDDENILQGFALLFASAGYLTESFQRVEKFLEIEMQNEPGCILLDVFLEGKTGLELQNEIKNRCDHLPIIYISGLGDIPMSVQALKQGAVNFLQKPVNDVQLIDAVEEALNISRRIILEKNETKQVKSLVGRLTKREQEVYLQLITGKLNKQIAGELNISVYTVKIHRVNIMKKLCVNSVAEMVRISHKIC
jgi:FixJ family two-component response regulator